MQLFRALFHGIFSASPYHDITLGPGQLLDTYSRFNLVNTAPKRYGIVGL